MSNPKFLEEMGHRISRQRKALNMTQEQVAEAMNISIQSLSCIELGKKAIRPENLYNLCITLGVSADYILMGRKSADQTEGVIRKLASLSEEDYQLVETVIHHLSNR